MPWGLAAGAMRGIGQGIAGGRGVMRTAGAGFKAGGGWAGMGAESLRWAGRGGIAGGAVGGGMGALGAMGDEDRTMAQGAFGGIARGAMWGAGAGAVGGAAWNVAGGGMPLTANRMGVAAQGMREAGRNAMANLKGVRQSYSRIANRSARNVPTNSTLGRMAHMQAETLRGHFSDLGRRFWGGADPGGFTGGLGI